MKAIRIVLCAALLLTGSLWLADSALAKPAYCDCSYCPEATHYKSCTDPFDHNVYDYLNWCTTHCFLEPFQVEPSAESVDPLSTDGACDVAPAPDTTDPLIELDLEPQPAL